MTARVIMLAGRGESTRYVFNALQRSIGVERVILEERVSNKDLIRRRLKKLGPRVVGGQILFKVLAEPVLRQRAQARVTAIRHEHGLDETPIPDEKIRQVGSVNSVEATEHLRACNPAVVVVNGTRIIAPEVLRCVSATFLNMHAGITPLYRGVHGGYWALANNDRDNCGVSVHVVDPGIDTGGIVGQARIRPSDDDSFVTYPVLQVAAGIPLLIEAVTAALRGDLQTRSAPAGTSRLWSHPTLGQYISARMLHGVR